MLGALSIEPQRMLALWNNWYEPYPRWRRLPPSVVAAGVITLAERCWSELIKNFGIGFLRRVEPIPGLLGDLTPQYLAPVQCGPVFATKIC